MEAAILGSPQRLVIFIAVVIVALVVIDLYNRKTGKISASTAKKDSPSDKPETESSSDQDA